MSVITNDEQKMFWEALGNRNVDSMYCIIQTQTSPSIDTHLPEEQSCQISSRSDLKRRSLGLFMKSVAPTNTTIEKRYGIGSWSENV